MGGVYGFAMGRMSTGMGRAMFKTLCVALLAVAAGMEAGSYWLPVALALCALGDFLLAVDGERAFLAGLVAFLLGHLAYVMLFWQVGGGEADFGAIGYGVVALVTLGVIWMSAKLWPRTGPMRLPVLAYTPVIAAMVVSAEAFTGSWLVRVGVLAFMASDMVLARERSEGCALYGVVSLCRRAGTDHAGNARRGGAVNAHLNLSTMISLSIPSITARFPFMKTQGRYLYR